MPKASVNKDRNLLLWESEVRPPGNWRVPAPACKAVRPQDPGKPQLRRSVATGTDCGHHPRTHLLGENIRHGWNLVRTAAKRDS